MRARLWLRVTVTLVRAVDGVVRRLAHPDRGRCPVTGKKHVIARFHHDGGACCVYCRRPSYAC